MQNSSRVAVACPGPSFDPKNIPDDFEVAAVNHTLKSLDRCRWWIAYDCPNDAHQPAADKFLELKPTIVTMPERWECWRVWFKDKLKLQPHEYPSFEFCDWGPLWFKTAIKVGPRYSSLIAISWALRRRVRELHYVGCDMGGVGYYDRETTQLPRNVGRKVRLWEQRWDKERALLKASQKESHKRGHMRITGLPWDDPPPLAGVQHPSQPV